ncbi:TetR/AcrR family transcriptional regulator [Corynebacterium sp. 13CS0277]|uniref:TetR/AcrR family transcriptional regulator n=1 Tax=Corynebacterium sp. 13CS0277 TaxID=2071994 RepID=UPI001304872B|nr:TetR/AcrR family transcriptional regulator [Corynebacterium sp. 13CS0277]
MKTPGRKSDIRAAAIALFAERGYYGTSMADIADAVHIRASSLYNHVQSKHELLAHIMVSCQQDLLREHGAAMSGAHTPAEQLSASMRCHVRFHATHQREVLVTNREINNLEDPDRTMLTQLRRDYVSRWVAILERGRAAGDFAISHPRLTSYALIDMGMGVAQWYKAEGPVPLEELAEHYVRLARRAVAAKETTAPADGLPEEDN